MFFVSALLLPDDQVTHGIQMRLGVAGFGVARSLASCALLLLWGPGSAQRSRKLSLLVGWSFGCLVVWLVSLLVCWFVVWSVVLLIDWLDD